MGVVMSQLSAIKLLVGDGNCRAWTNTNGSFHFLHELQRYDVNKRIRPVVISDLEYFR